MFGQKLQRAQVQALQVRPGGRQGQQQLERGSRRHAQAQCLGIQLLFPH
jgi:hypothetical protein